MSLGPHVFLSSSSGMILLSELSRRRIRSINKLIRVGRTEPVVVIRVDKDKGYIDLSKRRVSAEDIERCLEQVSKAKVIRGLSKLFKAYCLSWSSIICFTGGQFDPPPRSRHPGLQDQ